MIEAVGQTVICSTGNRARVFPGLRTRLYSAIETPV